MKESGLRYRLSRATGKQWRDGITYVIGIGGLIFETLSSGAEKPTLIIAFVGMIGLPLFLRKDENDMKTAHDPIPSPPSLSILIPTPAPDPASKALEDVP